MTAFGIDIGGSGVKGAPVDLTNGSLAGTRHRIRTPTSGTPDAIIQTVQEIIAFHEWDGPVGVTIPGVVIDGVVITAANISPEWVNYPAREAMQETLGVPVSVLNDADAAGLAENTFGAGKDAEGVVMLLTFGTGIGSALINSGVLVPNTEFGHLQFKGMEAETYAASRLVEHDGLDVDTWALRVQEFLVHLERIFSPDLFIFGGGISKSFSTFGHVFDTNAPVVPAVLRNNAGIVGAAMTSESGDR